MTIQKNSSVTVLCIIQHSPAISSPTAEALIDANGLPLRGDALPQLTLLSSPAKPPSCSCWLAVKKDRPCLQVAHTAHTTGLLMHLQRRKHTSTACEEAHVTANGMSVKHRLQGQKSWGVLQL